ncbi:MAG TPA: aspartate--ammonia ligase [Candidatus Marinimicrobia bacterium]|nr:aspartate--ammonia ligase [Candidatus Neomarinimicrobiota bacterium]
MQSNGFINGQLYFPEDYQSFLDLRETEEAIKYIKSIFQDKFAAEMNLHRVSAPIFVLQSSGINDYLSGTEQPVRFNIKAMNSQAEVVQSLAKWKRQALKDYGFISGEGLYTDMNAIRPDEAVLDNLHSVYVDQWDWERIIAENERKLDVLKYIVKKIYSVLKKVEQAVCRKYHQLPGEMLPESIHFIHSEELEELYPDLSPRERENRICEERGAVFIIGIGADLKSGQPHDLRAADYDDWITETTAGYRGLNGDILVWYPILNCAMELSSMGIRVDRKALLQQLTIKNEEYKQNFPFHQGILRNELPLSIGGGIGQSRLCMYFLRKCHIGEVHASVWSPDMIEQCRRKNVKLL